MKNTKYYISVPIIILIGLFYAPIANLFRQFFFSDLNTSDSLLSLFQDSTIKHITFFTLKQAFLSTICSLIIGLPTAYFISHYKFKGKNLLETLSFFPFILPTIIVALGFILFWGRFGWVNQFLSLIGLPKYQMLYTLKIILIAHTFYNFPIIMKIVGERWQHLDSDLFDAAKMLGANNFQQVTKILIPALLPAIIQSSTIVFVYCFMSFGIILVLGNVEFSTIEVSLYMLLHNLRDYNEGFLLAFLQMIFTGVLLFISVYVDHYFHRTNAFFKSQTRILKTMKWKEKIPFIFTISILIFLLFGPILSVIASAFVQNRRGVFISNLPGVMSVFSNRFDPILGVRPLSAVGTSLVLATITAISVVGIGILAALPLKNYKNKLIEFLFIAPLGISSITFTFAFIIYRSSFFTNFNSFILLAFIHWVLSFPMSFRIILRGVRAIPESTLESATMLGASQFNVIKKIVLPQMKSAMMLAFVFSFSFSLGEIGAASLIRGNFITIPVALYRYINSYNFAKASVFGFLLMFFATIMLVVIKKGKIKNL